MTPVPICAHGARAVAGGFVGGRLSFIRAPARQGDLPAHTREAAPAIMQVGGRGTLTRPWVAVAVSSRSGRVAE
jgi:hypothetical protein